MGGRIITGAPVGAWVAEVLGRGYFAERSEAIGLERDGQIVAGVIYEEYCGASIVCHIVIAGRLTSRYLAAIFDYPFNVAGVGKIIAPVSSGNAKALRVVKKMGFVEEGRIKDARPDGDFVMLTMTRDACRYLDARYGQKVTEAAPGT